MLTTIYIVLWLYVAIETYLSFTKHSPILFSRLSINPLLLAAGIQTGAGIVNLLQKRPDPPDVFSPAVRESLRSRARVEDTLSRQGDVLGSQLAAAGATGSGGAGQREALIRASSGVIADIDASLADLITNAGNQQRQLQFQDELSRFNATQNAVSQIANAGTSILSLNQLANNQQAQQGVSVPGPNPAVQPTPALDPLASQVAELNQSALAARTLPAGFDPNPLTPKVDPLTGRITFGG